MPFAPRVVFVSSSFLTAFFCAAVAFSGEYKDPAPPVVNALKPMDPPKPSPHPSVAFHTAPKPLPAGAVTTDWPCFLGATHDMKSPETKLLKEWPKEGPTLVWEMKRGTGYTSPSIAGERLVYMHREGDEELVECLKADTGERLWRFTYPTDYQDKYGYNNGPRASPVIAGDKVYTYGAQGKLHCLDLATGQMLWMRAINDEFKVPQDFFGTATTPLLEGNLLIINVGTPEGPCVAAFDKDSGKMAWACDAEGWGPSYASPVPGVVQGARRVFVFAGGASRPPTGGLVCLDPTNGKVDFTFPWRSKSFESVNASCPVVIGNQVFISATYQTGGALLNILPGFKPEVAWSSDDFGIHFMTAIHKDGYLYGFDGRHDQNSKLVCFEVKSGKEMWREQPKWTETVPYLDRLTKEKKTREITVGDYRGSLLEADGHFFCLGEAGHLQCWQLTPQGMKEIARSWIFAASETWTPLVLSKGLLYVVQNHKDDLTGTPPRLMCFDLRGK